MAKHQWSVLCKRSLIDQDDNSFSLMEVLEGVVIESDSQKAKGLDIVPTKSEKSFVLPIPCQFVSLWARADFEKPETETVRVQVKNPEGKIVLNQELDVNLNNSVRARHRIKLPGLFYSGPGIYRYLTQQKKVSKKNQKWVTVSELLFDITEKEHTKLD